MGRTNKAGLDASAERDDVAQHDRAAAVVIAAMQRAIAQLTSTLADKSARPAEGGHPVALTVEIAGDVVVGRAGEPGERTTIGRADLADALLANVPADDRASALARAVQLLKRAREGAGVSATKLAAARSDADAAVAAAGAKHAVFREATAGRSGAVSGKPFVRVSGSISYGAVACEVEAA